MWCEFTVNGVDEWRYFCHDRLAIPYSLSSSPHSKLREITPLPLSSFKGKREKQKESPIRVKQNGRGRRVRVRQECTEKTWHSPREFIVHETKTTYKVLQPKEKRMPRVPTPKAKSVKNTVIAKKTTTDKKTTKSQK